MTVSSGSSGEPTQPNDAIQAWLLRLVQHSLVVFELASGHYGAALALAPAAVDEAGPFAAIGLPDLIEAAVRSGDRATALNLLERLESGELGARTPTDVGLTVRSNALLAADPDAGDLYQQAIALLADAGAARQVARTQLLYGEWLRRRGMRQEACRQLLAAIAAFEAFGADAFATRARLELELAMSHARRRNDATRFDLTPQESRIAGMAADGATNPEIAAKLFISSNTVAYHLRKVYRKLGLTSRRQLAAFTHERGATSEVDEGARRQSSHWTS